MTCIDHSSRPSRLLVAAAVLLSTTLSLPASAAAPTADHTKVWKRKRSNRRYLQFTTTENSADDAFDSYKLLQQTGLNATVSSSSITQTKNNKGELICTPVEECELCPLKWKQLLDQDDEKVKGEFKSCTKYERRQRFECTALMQDNEESKTIAQSKTEYKPCRYTDSDEATRMLRMQIFCLVVGLWSVRNVRRQKMSSASLFDQRRMRGNAAQNGSGGGGGTNGSPSKHVKFSGYSRKDSMESVELGPLIVATTGAGKVPKSPAPMNMNAV